MPVQTATVKELFNKVKGNIVDLSITNGYGPRGLNRGFLVTTDLRTQYTALIATGDVFHDDAQVTAIDKLEDIRTWLEATSERRKPRLIDLFNRKKPDHPPGLYLWGGVGAGKSMLMDLFYATTNIKRKRRVHFHAFMQEIHDSIHAARKSGVDDPIAPVAESIAKSARLLCFDEVQITDITDAMIVGRLFEKLFDAGTVIVTTSNRLPEDLYKHGLNRQHFVPFINLISQRMEIHHLFTETDYRQDRLRGQQTWFTPIGTGSATSLNEIWTNLTADRGAPLTLKVKSRDVTLPLFHNGVARASFADLCEAPLGPADYLAITDAIRVLILDGIPKMSRAKNNEAKRFVTLIDTLYESKIQLICSAAAEPEELYETGTGAFEFERTASRLREMQSVDWGVAP